MGSPFPLPAEGASNVLGLHNTSAVKYQKLLQELLAER
jgi:hypothetical protein